MARKARAQETNNQQPYTWNERTYIKLKLILSPPGLSVPSSKINCISCRFRLVLLLLHCLTPQILMSSMYMSFHEHALRLFQGGKRLGDETSVSEQNGVMQWTGIELGARSKFKIQRSKFKILLIY